MQIFLSYSLRNLWARRMTTFLTAAGMALVVFVFAAVLMLDAGLKKAIVSTGSDDNVVVLRKGSETEVQSGVDRPAAATIESMPEVALGQSGLPLASKEMVVLISMNSKSENAPSNVTVRGVGPFAATLRPQVKLSKGRMFHPGSHEVVIGKSIARKFKGASMGDRIRFGGLDWPVVGVFEADGSGFESEIWGDVDQLMPAFRRPVYSSVLLRLKHVETFSLLKATLETDPRFTLEAKRERQYYTDQSEAMSTFINILGMTLTVIFSIGAIIGAMITMYAAVASRTGEIGTLRALGFRRTTVLGTFLVESLFLSLIGGGAGLVLASFMQLVTVSTMNFQSFAELAFSFDLTVPIIIKVLLFSLLMGFLGGFLPAARAAKLNIVSALRSA
jgi:ABC-type lipoprotein release transport system permease subunit